MAASWASRFVVGIEDVGGIGERKNGIKQHFDEFDVSKH
jgi:hypothetical protein